MIVRQLGKILRGKATPFQLAAACVLGSMLGFTPGVIEGPGVAAVAVLAVLVVVNANLFLAGLTAGLTKLASLALMSASFGVGRLVLDGPTRPIMQRLINAPVTAWFGLDYYATTGGLVLGALVGVLLAGLVVVVVSTFRARMARLEANSDTYKKYASKFWVRALAWIFLGPGKGKKTYAELATSRLGLPIRPLGVVFVLVAAGLLYVVWAFQNEWIVKAAATRALQAANGATVDIRAASLDLAAGELRLSGLAAADLSDLSRDRLRAAEASARIDTRDLLRRRLVIDSLELIESSTGQKRLIPGRRLRAIPPPRPPRPPTPGKTLDDYLKEAEVWRERLETAQRVLEELSSRLPEKDPAPGQPAPRRETLRERLAREVRELGYPNVRASHLVEGSPAILVREFLASGMKTEQAGQVSIAAANLSSHPWLVDDPPSVRVEIAKGRYVEASLDAVTRPVHAASSPPPNSLRFRYNAIPADEVAQLIHFAGQPPIQGGTVELRCERGRFALARDAVVSLPVAIIVRNTTVTIEGAGSAPVEKLAFPVRLRGPLSNPSVTIDDQALAKALADAGAEALANKVRERAGEEIDEAAAKLQKELAEELGDDLPVDLAPAADLLGDGAGDAANDLLGNILGGKKKDPKPDTPK